MAWTIDKVTARLREQLKAGRPLIGAGAGTGISAKSAEAGGVDLSSSIIPAVTGWPAGVRWRG